VLVLQKIPFHQMKSPSTDIKTVFRKLQYLLSSDRIDPAYIDLLIPAYTVPFPTVCGSCKNMIIMHIRKITISSQPYYSYNPTFPNCNNNTDTIKTHKILQPVQWEMTTIILMYLKTDLINNDSIKTLLCDFQSQTGGTGSRSSKVFRVNII